MHIVEETFHTITLRRWEASQVCNELLGLLGDGGGLDIEAYPALNTLFGGLHHIADQEIGATRSQDQSPGEGGMVIEFNEEETQ